MLTIATLITFLLPATVPQKPPRVNVNRGGSGTMRFVDFCTDLDLVTTKVGLGELGKFRDGKRKRIKDAEVHVGTGGSVAWVSGTQYYRVKSRTKLNLDTVLFGKLKKAELPLTFDVQLAKMPDGKLRRQILSKELRQTDLIAGMYGMWILETNAKRKKPHRVIHVIPKPKGMKRSRFVENARDMLDINRRLGGLKTALENARRRRKKGVPEDELRKALDAVLAQEKLALRNPENDRWTRSVLRPWKRRLREF